MIYLIAWMGAFFFLYRLLSFRKKKEIKNLLFIQFILFITIDRRIIDYIQHQTVLIMKLKLLHGRFNIYVWEDYTTYLMHEYITERHVHDQRKWMKVLPIVMVCKPWNMKQEKVMVSISINQALEVSSFCFLFLFFRGVNMASSLLFKGLCLHLASMLWLDEILGLLWDF